MESVNYKCPACAAPLRFNDKGQNWRCASCANEFTLENLKTFNDDEILGDKGDKPLDWETYDFNSGSGDWSQQEKEELSESRCESCGAEIIMDKNTAATKCVYCGNTVIIPQQVGGVFRPDYVIPFKLDKNAAMEKYKSFCKGKRLLPKLFLRQNHIEEITGIYVPFWIYDCDVHAEVTFNAKRVISHNSGKYIITHTDHFRLKRAGLMSFSHIPVDGSKKLADEYMEAIEPFDYSGLLEFTPAYLSGYLADKYDVNAKEGQSRVDLRVKATVNDMLMSTASGYNSVSVSGVSYNTDKTDIKYALFPVWLLNTKYNDNSYTFAMNGQTGKLVGKLPIDKGLYWKYLLTMSAGFSAAAYALVVILRLLRVL
jgi:DNA-directed RNA polymerase subunit RPC12/RpoP